MLHHFYSRTKTINESLDASLFRLNKKYYFKIHCVHSLSFFFFLGWMLNLNSELWMSGISTTAYPAAFPELCCLYFQKCISMCDRYLNRNNPGNKGDDNTSQQKQLCLNDNWVILWQAAQGLNPLTSCPSLTPEEGREERWHTTLSSQLHRLERLVKLGEITQSIHWQSHTHMSTSTVLTCM